MCCASIFVVVMDISVVTVALPAIHRDLDASVAGLQRTVDAYTLVLAGFLVLAGSVADRYGRRRVFLVGLTAFGVGSLLCGSAPSIGWLVAARAVQAAGGTMLNPVALAIVATVFSEARERARAIGVIGAVSGLALAVGPICGGALVDGFGWRSVFWINVPVVAIAVAATLRYVPESRAPLARRFDPVGQVLVVALRGRGPRIPLVVAGLAVVPAGVAALWLGPETPLLLVLVMAVLVGLFLGAVNPPITNSAVAGMPRSMAGVAGSLASVGRQTGTTLGVAIAGTGTVAGVGWLMVGLGATIVALGIVGTGARARATADRAATLVDEVDIGTRHGASHS